MEKKSLRVGLCLAESKREKLKLPTSISDLCRKNGINIIDIDMDVPLEEQGPFDIILHKILEFRAENKQKGSPYVDLFLRYTSKHKDVKLLDPVSTCEMLTNRCHTMEAVSRCEFTSKEVGKRVFVPNFCCVNTAKDNFHAINELISASNIRYPIIMKHYMGVGKVAHEMSIIFSESNLCDIKTPCFLQQFHNHDGYMLKIYTIGVKYYVCKRPSIKDLSPGNDPTVNFYSGNISKRGKHSSLHKSGPGDNNIRNNDPTLIEKDIVMELLQRLKTEFEFNLLGIDIIIDKETGNYGIIDVNYFPGYDGVKEHFPKDLVDLFLQTGQSLSLQAN